ncbi:MAG: NUDIX hydrolase [Alphaproteobacteria bacterium]|nr:NUDIX hydrolase [Alphaproteobacteria bacterium]
MKREYPERPIVAVGLVIWRGPRLLLIQRGRPPRLGQWSLPGGAQELGERVEDAARREIVEEAGIEIGPLHLIEVVDSIQRDDAGRILYHYTLVDFTAEWQGGEARPGGDVMALRWVERGELGGYSLWSETHRIIERAAALMRRDAPGRAVQ